MLKFLLGQKENKVLNVPIENIESNPYQPRKHFNMNTLSELSESIKQYGVLQPISVRKIGRNNYELIAGERRLRACQIAGLTEIPCIVVEADTKDSGIIALVENLQRENLSYFEEAEGYSKLLNCYNFTQDQLAEKLGKNQSTIANKLRLLRIDNEVRKSLIMNGLSERHARALLKIYNPKLQLETVKFICENDLNVKKTEEFVEEILSKQKFEASLRNHNPTEPCSKRVIGVKDVRIFINTLRKAVELIKKSGITPLTKQNDLGDSIEYIVTIPKKF